MVALYVSLLLPEFLILSFFIVCARCALGFPCLQIKLTPIQIQESCVSFSERPAPGGFLEFFACLVTSTRTTFLRSVMLM